MNLLRTSFILFISIFLIFEALKFSGFSLPEWTTSYLNDFLCMPIVLLLCLFAVQHLKSDSSIRLSLPLILTLTAFYSFYFELLLPEISVRYTADLFDVVVYFIGALLFYSLQKISSYK